VNINKIIHTREIYLPIILVFVSLLLIWILGIPAFTKEGNERSFLAFREHFAINWNEWTKSNILHPWRQSTEIFSQYFGNPQSISEAFLNNPFLFIKHIMSNLKNLFPVITKLLSPIYNDLFRQILLPINKLYHGVGKLLLFIGLASYVFINKEKSIQHMRTNLLKNLKLIIFFGLYSIPGLISVAVIYPRNHYLLLPMFFLIAIIAILIFSNDKKIKPLSLNQILIVTFSIIVLTPTPKLLFGYKYIDGKNHQERLNTIKFLNSLELKDKVNLLVTHLDYCYYIPEQFQCISAYSKENQFDQFMNDNKINAVLVNDELENNKRFKSDREWSFFLTNYMKSGYIKLEILHTRQYLIIKEFESVLIFPSTLCTHSHFLILFLQEE
jgi:hypothetical protein